MKTKNKYKLQLFIIMLVIYLGVNGIACWFYYQNYCNSIDVIAQMISDDGRSQIDIAVDILKENQMQSVTRGKLFLESYGYLNTGENILYHRFLVECLTTAIVTFLLFILAVFQMVRWKKTVIREENSKLVQIEKVITNFRENNFAVVLQMDNQDEQEKIKYQLEALGNYLKLLKEEACLEKEGTKELVSDISHQLKTPVAALDACFTVLLSENLSEEEQKEFQIRCRNALDGLETLLQSLLQISKMEAGLIQIDKKKEGLIETIVTAVNRTYPKASEKNIELSFDYGEELENYEVIMDKKWFCEAIINLLDNAIKYSSENSEIMIRIQKRTGFARIEIEDQGIGIPREEYHKIFQRFYRGYLPSVKEESGSGIGLFLTREIIEKHHGTIIVSSHYGMEDVCGSTFVIQLPEDE